MSKPFLELFHQIMLPDDLAEKLSSCTVEKVGTTGKGTLVRVYLDSTVLFEKQEIWQLERELAEQVFDGMKLSVQIKEHYHLSDAYTPRTLMDAYGESFLQELRAEDPVLCTLYQSASLSFPEEHHLVITLEDGVIERDGAPRLKRVMETLLNGRFGFDATVECAFTERKEKRPVQTQRFESQQMAYAEEDVPEETKSAGSAHKTPRRGTPEKQNAYPRKVRIHPDALYGKPFQETPVKIELIEAEDGRALCVSGRVISCDYRKLKSEKCVLTFGVYDRTDSINVKMFTEDEEEAKDLKKVLEEHPYVRVLGTPRYDDYEHEMVLARIRGIMEASEEDTTRVDAAEEKRTELHCHTQMSDMDAVSSVKDIVKRAYKWEMPGIAITDHGVVQALTEAGHVLDDLYKDACKKADEAGAPKPDRQDFFKVIPGAECYVVDDGRRIAEGEQADDTRALTDIPFVVFDLETTGFSARKNRIIEIGAVKIEHGQITDRFSAFVNPGMPIPYKITKLTGITDAMVRDAGDIAAVLPQFTAFAEDAVLVGHNVSFDISFVKENCKRLSMPAAYTTIDTLALSRMFFPRQARHTLDAVAKTMQVVLETHHRAVDDAEATARIFLKFLNMLAEKGADTLADVNAMGTLSDDALKHLRPQHMTLLAKNTLGRVNLYRLISASHLRFFHRYPLIPKSLLTRYREGLLVGSADAHGALFEALMEDRSEEEIAQIIRFCDFLEVQPEENYYYMLDNDRYEFINNPEDIRRITERILRLGEQYGKPVCATSDAHFLDPDDVSFRTVLVEGKDIKGGKAGENQDAKRIRKDDARAPLYLRTTDEMLEAFSFLGRDRAKKIVIDNPKQILDMCDAVSPVRPDKCPPVIPDSDKELRRICYEKANEIYGDPLPELVEKRLEKELTSIISNGYAVMYIIAQKLVWKSIEDGYIVGSRGSVGSSFVAFAAGITEVNALPPHYVCPSCKYSDFESDEVLEYAGGSGCDMPDRVCPHCGTPLYKDGFDIPFETFLGFSGNKEPDIDLNFSGEYQARAHKYTEEIFGKGQTFRAGTVAGLQDKTAYGVVKKYVEFYHIGKKNAEINRLVQGLSGVRHGTGQHPGGIIVLPFGEDINSFTPVQRPANKQDTDTVTTHYDFHSIDHNLLKLDILGHDDPTMVRFLHDVTGIDPTKAPLDDPEVMQLFTGTEPLGITPEQIGGTKLGCLGLPEFGTDFAMQMVIDAKPTCFSHLIRIAGLAHGTDVWLGNARDLILNNTATIDTAICNRDDIMNYLIGKGVDPKLSFNTMESVRKGKGLTDEMKTAMLNARVPEWYIDSCIKIKYMFPKAHATAYVMNGWRIGWFKVHEPLAFYAAWFSIRAKQLNYTRMFQGKDALMQAMAEYQNNETELTDVQKNEYYAMRVAQEMYERGYECTPIDLKVVQATRFTVVDGKIMPSLLSIEGMGETAAQAVCDAVKDGPFLSRDDFKERTKCPQKVVDTMHELGLLGDIPESNQMSLFDLI